MSGQEPTTSAGTETAVTPLRVLAFTLETTAFAFPITQVQEILTLPPIVPLPRTPSFVRGVANLRGTIIPVVDLRDRLGLPPKAPDESTRLVVVRTGPKTAGFIVDTVTDVLDILPDALSELPAVAGRVSRDVLTGIGRVGDQVFLVVRTETLLEDAPYSDERAAG